MASNHGVNTRLAHGGYDPRSFHGFVNPPVVHASTVLFPDAEAIETRNQPYTYGTYGTPTTDALNSAMDALEGSAGPLLAIGPGRDHPALHVRAKRR
jgi:cystathionine beta-lyase